MRTRSNIFQFVCCVVVTSGHVLAQDQTHHTLRYFNSAGNPASFETFTFSPDSKKLAVSAASRVELIDVATGTALGKHESSPWSICFSRDGRQLHMISRYKQQLWDTQSRTVRSAAAKPTPGSLGFALEQRSGKLLFSKIFPTGPTDANRLINIGDELVAIAEGHNSRWTEVLGWSVEKVYQQLKGPVGTSARLKVLPRGRFGDEHTTAQVIRRQIREYRDGRYVFKESVANISDNLAWVTKGERIELRSAGNGSTVAHLEPVDVGIRSHQVISPDQTRFAFLGGQVEDASIPAVEVFDIATQKRVALMPLPRNEYSGICFSSDGMYLLVATWDAVQIADVASGQFVGRLNLGWQSQHTPAKRQRQSNANSSSNIRTAVAREIDAGGADSDDRRSRENLVWKIAASSRGIVATANRSGEIKLWDLVSGSPLAELPRNPEAEVSKISFSPDGLWLAYHIEGVTHIVDVSDVKPVPIEEVLDSLEARRVAADEEDLGVKLQFFLDTYMAMSAAEKPEEVASALENMKLARWEKHEKLVLNEWDQSSDLNSLAWRLSLGAKPKNLELALRAAKRALELAPSSKLIADTLGRVYFEMGDLDKAVEMQGLAAERDPDDRDIQRALLRFRSARARARNSE